MSEKKNLEWMYDGPKSIINREDYLLGKKIDRNFELFSDVVVKEKDETDELIKRTANHLSKSISASTSKTSALETNVVRNEDPLVALKFQEEKRRQEMLNNPLMKMKAEKILKREFEKLMEKSKKKHKRRKSESSEIDSRSNKKASKKLKKYSNSPETINKNYKRSSRSPQKSSHSKNKSNSPFEIHHHRHLEKKYKESSSTKTKSSSSNLTAEEKEIKRKAMLANANWRDEVRKETVELAAERLRKEEEHNETQNPVFLKSLLSSATNSQNASVEKRLQSNKKNLQRTNDFMSQSFASRK